MSRRIILSLEALPRKTPHMYIYWPKKILMACASFEGLNSDRSNRCIATNENDDDDCYDHSTEIKSCRNQIKFYLWRISPRSCLLDRCQPPLPWYIVIELENAHNPDLDINVIYLALSDSELFSSSSSLLSGSIGCWCGVVSLNRVQGILAWASTYTR